MKLEDLLTYSADELDKLTDQQIEELCAPWYPKCRPELQPVTEKRTSNQKNNSNVDRQQQLKINDAIALAKSMGINIKKK
jgi:hypothetical protein